MRKLTLLILATQLLSAQTGEKRIALIDPAKRQAFEQQRKLGVAILVGVGKYPRYSGLSELRYTTRDVDLLAKELEGQRYLVISLKDGEATKGAVLNAIQQAGEVVDSKNGTLIFFFSGHGFADKNANFLATFDAASNNLAQSGLSLPSVEQALAATGAPRRVLWVDACRNEPGKGPTDGRSFAKFDGSAGSRILFSTKAGRISYEDDELQQGLFSYYLVRGLRGEAARSDGLVTFRDLADYVADGVQARSLKQGRVQVPYEAGEASGDFLLARSVAVAPQVPAKIVPAPAEAMARPSPPTGTETRIMPRPVKQNETDRTKVNPKDGLTYVWIGPGRFRMGCSAGDSECAADEQPAHEVTITKGLWMGRTEVTQAAYERVTGQNPSYFKGVDLPVEKVSWYEANSYCTRVGMRLPTEAEWEYAARAGGSSARYGEAGTVGWYYGNSGSKTHPVAGKQANEWGLYDMLGNVWEWTADWYGPYNSGASIDPTGPGTGIERVLRGGSWLSGPSTLRVSVRDRFEPGDRYNRVGLRCVGE